MKEIKVKKEPKGSKPKGSKPKGSKPKDSKPKGSKLKRKQRKSPKGSKLNSPRKQSKLKYQELYMKYLDHGLSQTSLLIIRRIASNPEIPSYFRCQPLLRFIESAVIELMMNEFEITLFGIYLENFGWEDKEFPLELILACSGLVVKRKLSQQSDIILGHFESIFPSFGFSFKSWEIKYENLLEIDSRHINLKYASYSSPTESPERIINYNYVVDDILRTSLSYNIAEPTVKEESGREDQVSTRFSPRNGKEKVPVSRRRPKCILTKASIESDDLVVEPRSVRSGFSAGIDSMNYSSGFMLGRIDSLCTELLNLSRPGSMHENNQLNLSRPPSMHENNQLNLNRQGSIRSGMLEVSRNDNVQRDLGFSFDEFMERSPDLCLALSPMFKKFVPGDECKRFH